MWMKPPHYRGISYNGNDVPDGAMVNVLPVDVQAHLAEGWIEVDATMTADLPPGAVVAPAPKE